MLAEPPPTSDVTYVSLFTYVDFSDILNKLIS